MERERHLCLKQEEAPIVTELREMVDTDATLREMLTASIQKAAEVNPDLETNPVQSLTSYYSFLDTALRVLPVDVIDSPHGFTREHLLHNIAYFHFLVDQPISSRIHYDIPSDTVQYYQPFSRWMSRYMEEWGAFLDSGESWSKKHYEAFRSVPSFGLNNGWYESPDNWGSFNDFFTRRLRSNDVRPITSPDDPTIVVSPADSVPMGQWQIDHDLSIAIDDGLDVKLLTYTTVDELLAKSQYASEFAGGTLTHTFLNISDYHNFHFPVGGEVREIRHISDHVALETTWNPEDRQYEVLNSLGWQFSQTRSYVVLDTHQFGFVALVPVGMSHVSRIEFEEAVTVGTTIEKGDLLGRFLGGGSDFIILFEEAADFQLTAPRDEDEPSHKEPTYSHLLVGEEYGVVSQK